MDYRKFGDAYYIRMDKGEEMVSTLLDICKKENIPSATFTGVGGCRSAEVQTFIPEKGEFETHKLEGALELISFIGNAVVREDGDYHYHVHALYSYIDENGKHAVLGGHINATTVLYTAEIELRPVCGGKIGLFKDEETGTEFWDLSE